MRARNIKPGFFENEELAELPFEARLLYIGLWCLADREGRFEYRPKRIKALLFPYDDIDVECHLMSLHVMTLISLYKHENKLFAYLPNFKKHQNPHPHEAKSVLPDPEMSTIVRTIVKEESFSTIQKDEKSQCHDISLKCNADSLIPDTLIPDSNTNTSRNDAAPSDGRHKKPTKGRKAQLSEWVNALGNGLKDWFETEWWPIQLRKVGKKECAIAIYDLNPNADLRAQIVKAYISQRDSDFCHREIDKVPHPATWINGARWEDEVCTIRDKPKEETWGEKKERELREMGAL